MDKGMEKGIMQEKYNTARKMKTLNVDADTIMKVTGLTKEEINSL